MATLEEIARTHRARLVQLETEYLRAREYLKSDKFSLDQLSTLAKIRKVVRSSLREPPSEMHFTLGRIDQILSDAFEWENVIAEYESIQGTLAKMFPPK